MTIHEIITGILAREGGGKYTNRVADRGGPTKYGITQATLAYFRGHPVTAEDVRGLTEGEARIIYENVYITDPGFDKIADEALRIVLIDFGVHSGPRRAIEQLQMAVGTMIDGVIGPNTLGAMERLGADECRRRVVAFRIRYLVRLVINDVQVRQFRRNHPHTNLENLNGWINRATEFI